MRKAYSKPQIMFEDFTLSTNIAAGCEVKTNTPSQEQCGYGEEFFGYPIFTKEVTGCINLVQDGFNSICYHNPSDLQNLFNS